MVGYGKTGLQVWVVFKKVKLAHHVNPANWDIKSTLGLIVIIIVFVLIVMVLTVIPKHVRDYNASKYDCQTIGTVLLIKADETQSQDFDGAKMVIPNYTVYFNYNVDGQWYDGSNSFPNQRVYKAFIYEVYKSNYKMKITVKYKRNNPKESLIIVDE